MFLQGEQKATRRTQSTQENLIRFTVHNSIAYYSKSYKIMKYIKTLHVALMKTSL